MYLFCLRARAVALGLCLAISAAPAIAITQIPQPLTLDAALDWAREHNPTVRAARLRVERLGGEAIHADVAVPSNPRVELEAGQRSTAAGDTTDIGIRLSQELWIAGQGGLRQAAAESDLGAARLDYAFLQAAITARTRAAFLSVLVAEKSVATAERVVDANEQLSNFANKRLSAGAGTQLETNAARLGLSRSQALLARARNRARHARLRLSDLLAIDPERRLAIRGELGFERIDLPQSSQLVSRAVQRRSDLNAAAKRVLSAQKRLSLAQRQIIPNLTVFGFYREEGGGKGGGLRQSGGDGTASVGGADIVGGGVSFDLPVLHRYSGERQVASAELGQAQLEQANLQRDVRLQVLGALSDYRAARAQVATLNDAILNAAEQTLELTRRSFSAGEVGAPAITTAQNNLISVRRDYLDALDALVIAGTDLERATGGLVVMDRARKTAE